jgi:broad specificity phosphatase PhoE
VLVAHGHPLRALTVRWLRLHPDGGRPFRPATGTLSTRGVERSQPVILSP